MTEKKTIETGLVSAEETSHGTPLVSEEVLDGLMAHVEETGELLGPEGLLSQVTKAVLERALDEELTGDLGYERGDLGGRGSGNGSTPKSVHTDMGTLELDIPEIATAISNPGSCLN